MTIYTLSIEQVVNGYAVLVNGKATYVFSSKEEMREWVTDALGGSSEHTGRIAQR